MQSEGEPCQSPSKFYEGVRHPKDYATRVAQTLLVQHTNHVLLVSLLFIGNLVQAEFAIFSSSILLRCLHHFDREGEPEQPSQHNLPSDFAHVSLDLLPRHLPYHGFMPLLLQGDALEYGSVHGIDLHLGETAVDFRFSGLHAL